MQKIILLTTKIITCGILYLIARNNSSSYYDISFPFLFFNFGILANGMIIYRAREFEEMYLSFYRGLPLSIPKRFLNYATIYFILLLPEFLTIVFITPEYLHYNDAISFGLCAYALLLLINSITFFQEFSKREFATAIFVIFCFEYIFLLLLGLYILAIVLATATIICFTRSYYNFENKIKD